MNDINYHKGVHLIKSTSHKLSDNNRINTNSKIHRFVRELYKNGLATDIVGKGHVSFIVKQLTKKIKITKRMRQLTLIFLNFSYSCIFFLSSRDCCDQLSINQIIQSSILFLISVVDCITAPYFTIIIISTSTSLTMVINEQNNMNDNAHVLDQQLHDYIKKNVKEIHQANISRLIQCNVQDQFALDDDDDDDDMDDDDVSDDDDEDEDMDDDNDNDNNDENKDEDENEEDEDEENENEEDEGEEDEDEDEEDEDDMDEDEEEYDTDESEDMNMNDFVYDLSNKEYLDYWVTLEIHIQST
jgi:hypothetical protein